MELRPQNIFDEQQAPRSIELLRASSVSSRATQRLDGARLIIGLVVATFGVVASFWSDLRPAASIAGAAAALVTVFVWSIFRTEFTTRSAIIQDQFDRRLFQLNWPASNPSPLIHAHIAGLARRDKSSHDKPWYADVRGVPSPAAETYCQRESLVWDSDLRTLWIRVCVIALIAVCIAEVVAALALQLTLWQFIVWFIVPTSSLLSTLIVNLRNQLRNTRLKKTLAQAATVELERVANDRTAGAIQAAHEALEPRQHELFKLRADGVRVPNWFYRLLENQFESDHAADATHLREEWANWARATDEPGPTIN